MKQFGLVVLALVLFAASAIAQCATWNELGNKEEVEEMHVLFRDNFKMKAYDKALSYWEKLMASAPAADGKRDYHFSNGTDMLLEYFKKETDATKKEALKTQILELYDQWFNCATAGTFQLTKRNMKTYPGYIRGREAYNMFYTLNVPYEDNLAVLKEAVEIGGNDTEYIVLDPYARIVQYQFSNELMSKEEARAAYEKLNAIADYNIANNAALKTYYQQAKESMNAVFATIENYIFDCDFFKDKLMPEFEQNKSNGAKVAEIYNTLVQRGCSLEDPLMVRMKGIYQTYADSINRARQDSLYKLYPGIHAKDLYKEGEYENAVEKWKQAIEKGDEDDKIAEYNYWVGYTEYYKLNNTNTALSYARKGVSSSEYGGKAYMLIGDIYAKMSRSCGDPAWGSRLIILAAIDKYSAARSKDSDIADEASSKIGNYSAFKPSKEEGFSRTIKEGQVVTAPCVGEKVKVRFSQ